MNITEKYKLVQSYLYKLIKARIEKPAYNVFMTSTIDEQECLEYAVELFNDFEKLRKNYQSCINACNNSKANLDMFMQDNNIYISLNHKGEVE